MKKINFKKENPKNWKFKGRSERIVEFVIPKSKEILNNVEFPVLIFFEKSGLDPFGKYFCYWYDMFGRQERMNLENTSSEWDIIRINELVQFSFQDIVVLFSKDALFKNNNVDSNIICKISYCINDSKSFGMSNNNICTVNEIVENYTYSLNNGSTWNILYN